ncbi:hypothetical protein GGS21DRAFT_493811 [Xylaria nigripes]|nr:hypothetical protein GGS21DRAFT_493811 [Xylaria nigripes]
MDNLTRQKRVLDVGGQISQTLPAPKRVKATNPENWSSPDHLQKPALFLKIRNAPATQKEILAGLRDLTMKLYRPGGLAPEGSDSPPNENDRVTEVFRILRDIRQKAAEAVIYERNESAWNSLVHMPLLELVFASSILDCDRMVDQQQLPLMNNVSVRCEMVTAAFIAPDSLPTLRKPSADLSPSDYLVAEETVNLTTQDHQSRLDHTTIKPGNRENSKWVEFVLVMDILKTEKLDMKISRAVERINCRGTSHVNQSIYRPINRNLIAVSIETKTDISQHDPFLQLGTWVSAWHSRMYALRHSLSCAGPRLRLVSLPLIQVVGHLWQIFFACDLGTSIDVFGPIRIGGTDSIAPMYTLLTSLEAVKEWIETVFQDSMKKCFMITDGAYS